MEGHFKNIDDILTTSSPVDQMEQRRLLGICQVKNIKLNPEKFNIRHKVTYGGMDLKGTKAQGDTERNVYMAPALRRLEEFLALEAPKTKKKS